MNRSLTLLVPFLTIAELSVVDHIVFYVIKLILCVRLYEI